MIRRTAERIPLKDYWRLLSHYLEAQWVKIGLLIVLLLVSIGLQLFNPQVLRYYIDTVTVGGPRRLWLGAAIVFIVVALIRQVLTIVARYVSEQVGWTATNLMRTELAEHCLKLDLPFHKEHSPGELIERVDGDITALGTFFSEFVVLVIGNLILLLGVLVVLFVEDWRIGAALTAFVLVALFVLDTIRDLATPYWVAARQATAEMFGFLQERLDGTEDIRANGATGYTMQQFYRFMAALLPIGRAAYMRGRALWPTTVTLFALGNTLALILGASLFTANQITIGTIYLIFYYTEIIRAPLEQITDQVENLQKANASIRRVSALLLLRSNLVDGDGPDLAPGPLAISLDRVSFGYQADAPVLSQVTFDVQPGRVLGVLGRTGSGKTTLTRLLLRFYDPTSGAVRLNGIDMRDLPLADVRRRVGIVTQDVQLFDASVRDNLTFFDPTISDQRILDVLHDLSLDGWYRGLPLGLDTRLEGADSGLSAGEAQLLAFARVFLKDPGLVILDEASSRLDRLTEQRIERAIEKLLENRTGIIIAHRLATIQRTDEVLILNAGQIEERGGRAALANDPTSHFAQLLRLGLEEVLR